MNDRKRFILLMGIKSSLRIALEEKDIVSPSIRKWMTIASRLGFAGITRQQALEWVDEEIKTISRRHTQ